MQFGKNNTLFAAALGLLLLTTLSGCTEAVGRTVIFENEVEVGIDTNAETACPAGEVLYGDGTCAAPGAVGIQVYPNALPWADVNVADNITVEWAGITGNPYIPNEADIDGNASQFDTNATTECSDTNSVLTSEGNCVGITGFHIQGAGASGLDTTLDSNSSADANWLGTPHVFTADNNFTNIGIVGQTFASNFINLHSNPIEGLHAATKHYVDTAVSGLEFDFFFTDTASDIGGYWNMVDIDTGEAESSHTTAGLAAGNNQLIESFVTEDGTPEFPFLIASVYDAHFHAEKEGGASKIVKIYWTLSNRSPGGTETVLFTSEESEEIVDDSGNFDVHAVLAEDEQVDGNRLVVKFYANITGGGGTVDIILYQEGVTDSHVALRSATSSLSELFLLRNGNGWMNGDLNVGGNRIINAGDSNFSTIQATAFFGNGTGITGIPQDLNAHFVPYIGAVFDLNLGAFGLTSWDLNAFSLTVTNNAYFDGNIQAEYFTSRDGTVSVTWGMEDAGYLDLDGANGTDTEVLAFGTDIVEATGTITAWINLTTAALSDGQWSPVAWIEGGGDQIRFAKSGVDDFIATYRDGAVNYTAQQADLTGFDSWIFVAMTWEYPGSVRLYTDDPSIEIDSTAILGAVVMSSSDDLSIGGRPTNAVGQYFHGGISDVTIWGIDLTPAELKDIFDEGRNPTVARMTSETVYPTNIISWWRFNSDALDTEGSWDGTLEGNAFIFSESVKGFTVADSMQVTKNLIIDGVINSSGNIVSTGDFTAGGTADIGGLMNLGGRLRVNGNIQPLTDDDFDLGASTLQFDDLWIDGQANIDELLLSISPSQGLGSSMVPDVTGIRDVGSSSRWVDDIHYDTLNVHSFTDYFPDVSVGEDMLGIQVENKQSYPSSIYIPPIDVVYNMEVSEKDMLTSDENKNVEILDTREIRNDLGEVTKTEYTIKVTEYGGEALNVNQLFGLLIEHGKDLEERVRVLEAMICKYFPLDKECA